MKNILIATLNMNIGGVENSLISLLHSLSPADYNIDLLLLENKGEYKSEIPDWVNTFVLKEFALVRDDLNRPPLQMIRKHFREKNFSYALGMLGSYSVSKITGNKKWYYKTIFRSMPEMEKHYDIAISYSSIISYLTYYVMNYVNADQKYGWIHFDISKYGQLDKNSLFMHEKMDKIYVVSKEALDAFRKRYPSLADKCELKYNVVDAEYIKKMAEEPVESIKEDGVVSILTLGRLSREKGQDVIPEVAKLLLKRGLKFRWYLVGDGNYRNVIEEKISECGLSDTVILLGTKKNPYPYLRQADIYVQTSLHEGYCITLAEAKVFGMPIVSTDFTGAHEQLDGREHSKVVERRPECICDAICQVVKEMKENARN